MSETDLTGRARQGDGAAWELLMRQHEQAVFRLAYLLLGDADQAKDVAQETFLRAYRSFNRYDAERPLRPWLLSIAANLARNQRRSIARYLAALQRLVQEPASQGEGLEAQVLQNSQAETLWQAIRQLGQDDQQVIYLRYFLDLPVAEAAQALGVAEGTVKSRLSRALTRLHAVIEQDYPALREGFEG